MATFSNFKGRSGTGEIRVMGLKNTVDRLKDLQGPFDGVFERELLQMATRVAKQANRDVPVKTGALLRSIQVVKRGSKNIALLVKEKYAGFVEFGTSKMQKQPYLFKHFPPQIKRMVDNIKKIIEK